MGEAGALLCGTTHSPCSGLRRAGEELVGVKVAIGPGAVSYQSSRKVSSSIHKLLQHRAAVLHQPSKCRMDAGSCPPSLSHAFSLVAIPNLKP